MKSNYTMKISRLTVDKLGVKLYDKVSAVIAELVANSYDADATGVTIEAPMGEYLASKAGGEIRDKGLEIKIIDNGIGMTPDEVKKYYLVLGAERRADERPGRGDTSRKFGRRVMGRKGVGKLAPFGICEVIEIISSGGDEITRVGDDGNTEKGFLTAHLVLNRKDIVQDTDQDYPVPSGSEDNTLRPESGTTVILRQFAYRRVPDQETFLRQLSQRFGLRTQNWSLVTKDTTKREDAHDYEATVGPFLIDKMKNSELHFLGPDGPNMSTEDGTSFRATDSEGSEIEEFGAGFHLDGRFFPITGWVAYSKNPYEDDLMAGIRIYCRGKIAAQTTVFNRGAGFQGEHSIRSYLVGEIHADWLDEEEDLIQTDRRDILWSSDVGQTLQDWGQQVMRKIGTITRNPMRKKTRDRFFEIGRVEERVEKEFPSVEQESIRNNARELAKIIGQAIRPDEVEDLEVVEPMVDLSLVLAPHLTLDRTLKQAASAASTPMAAIGGILRTARLAELSSFGRIAADRLRVIDRLRNLKDDAQTAELRLQELITMAPWLIDPQWAPITANQTFITLRREFVKFYKKKTGEDIILGDFTEGERKPDFVLSSQDDGLQIIEIKRPEHKLNNAEMDRIIAYVTTMAEFLDAPENAEFRRIFREFHVTLVCDGIALSGAQGVSFDSYVRDGRLRHINWSTFLLRTELMHRGTCQRL